MTELNAEERRDTGKSASRRLRRAGKIPAILYGARKEPLALALNQNEINQQLEREAFHSSIITLKWNGNSEKVVLKDLQRHPYLPQVLHLDFLRIDEHKKLTMRVPIHFINQDKCIGVKQQGGIATHLMTELEIVCLPKDLPEYIGIDVANVHVGTTLHLSDIQLPQGVQIAALLHGGDPAQPVFSVHMPRIAAEATEGEAVEVEVGPASAEETSRPEPRGA